MTTVSATYPWRQPLRWTWTRFATTTGSPAQALLRVTLGLVLLPHGAQHLLGLFGGYGFSATLKWMTGPLGIPAPFAAAGIVLEFFGSLALIAGVAGRAAGLAVAVFMATAASTHLQNGFFMNWFGALPAGTEGFEYHLLTVAIALAIAINGSGAYSIDRLLTERRRARG